MMDILKSFGTEPVNNTEIILKSFKLKPFLSKEKKNSEKNR